MVFRQIEPNGDWTFGKGKANYAQDANAIALNIKTLLKSWVGDCFFALRDGIDWHRLLDTGQQRNLQVALQTLILQSYGVVSVTSVSAVFDPVSRRLEVQYAVTTIFSQSFRSQVTILANGGGTNA